MTSHDVVARARRALGERRIGHHGTLDPFATGLLVLLVGRATRLAPYVDGEPKVYEAEIRFGAETSTDDVTGEETRTALLPDQARVLEALPRLTGQIDQLPPAYSAKKVDGERAYAAARAGRAVELTAVPVRVDSWEVLELAPQLARVRIQCGGGTYIRSLARDLGRLVDSAAHLTSLRRTASGPFRVQEAVAAESLTRETSPALLSPLAGLTDFVRRPLEADEIVRVTRGMRVDVGEPDVPGHRAALLDAAGTLVAIAERADGAWQPRVVLRDQ